MLAQLKLLETFGPQLGRPRVDTLNGSVHANMKELRFDAAGGYGDLRSRSILNARRLSFAEGTSREAAKRSFIKICYVRLMPVLPRTLRG
jgi:Phage derived protein Gp49-like (DUF891)